MNFEKINEIANQIDNFAIQNKTDLENFRIKFLKYEIKALMDEIKNIAPEHRKNYGIEVNALKNKTETKWKEAQEILENAEQKYALDSFDLTLPNPPHHIGAIHPLSLVKQRIIEIFERIGFSVADGPEIEDDFHNFTALNFPPDHPAREMQDTFFLEKNPDILLRTHTSSVQVRMMETKKPPLRMIMPGRVFRNEAITARANCIFHQVEGLYIDENVSLVDLKQTLYHFAKEMFGEGTKIRFRSSYFPFTEISAEVDISCSKFSESTCKICGGSENVCKGTGWIEILGCGMVDPNVLEQCGIDSEKYTGFAFGMGIERIAMIKYQIKDLRLFTENDVRFVRQFSNVL
jgi:phenylalanyl-tRNA synthetase alpha chain